MYGKGLVLNIFPYGTHGPFFGVVLCETVRQREQFRVSQSVNPRKAPF